MNLKSLLFFLILCSLLGISATFMPWLHFPKSDSVLYGYVGDGIVTAIVFVIILLIAAYAYRKNSIGRFSYVLMGVLGLMMAYLSYYKLETIEQDKLNFTADNALMAAAFAGAHQGIGVYVFGIAGLGVFVLISAGVLLKTFQGGSSIQDVPAGGLRIKARSVIAFVLILILGAIYFYPRLVQSEIALDGIRPAISESVNKMGNALSQEDYETFADYNHVVMQQSMGGKQKLIDLVKSTVTGLREKGTIIDRIELMEIHHAVRKGKNIQAVITQKVTFINGTEEINEMQKMLAVSDDVGKTWHFMNVTGKTAEQIKSFFPSLNSNLKF